ncbi:DNA-binding response regulator [Bosea caraganae]|uniref:DNA-binding response regulator n=1 Tax=Bosea caraganae TaxID=2763117 RepID=A0A370L9R1_9HYPH|nr:response regulator transcription factor [Bosea caraganae]RDJ21925.1 DNA-binding response regulator [Bosea caraganae]RDJ28043.1 DNA-binding response regulator [Bosea caraganae]
MKFLVVDDHALICEAMRSVLQVVRPDCLVLEASDAAAALATLEQDDGIDLVLLDLHLPDQNGLSLLETLSERHPTVAVVMISGDREQSTIRDALARGAQGFIPKTETREVLIGALSLVLAGGIYVPPAALQKQAAAHASGSSSTSTHLQSLGLTERQLDVLALLMEGKNNKLICRALGLAEPTVKNHISAILKTLGVGSRTEAVLAVTRLGWSKPAAG